MKREEGQLAFGNTIIHYTLYRSKNRYKTLSIAIDSEEGLVLTAPDKLSLQDIESVTKRKASWIIEKLGQQKNDNAFDFREFVSGETIRYLGRQYLLKISESPLDPSCKMLGKWLNLTVPEGIRPLEKRLIIKQTLIHWLKDKSYLKVRERLDFYAAQMGLAYSMLIMSDQKKRWGSCDVDGNIRINWRIVMAPLSLIDYILVHELCHLVHHNHTSEFWQLLEDYLPDYRKRRERLKAEGSEYTLF